MMARANVKMRILNNGDLARLARNFKREDIEGSLNRGLLRGGMIAERGMKMALTTGPTRAIDTGFLRSSVRINEFKKNEFIAVGTNTNYDVYIHEGTSRMRARPYTERTVQIKQEEFEELMKKTGLKITTNLVRGV